MILRAKDLPITTQKEYGVHAGFVNVTIRNNPRRIESIDKIEGTFADYLFEQILKQEKRGD